MTDDKGAGTDDKGTGEGSRLRADGLSTGYDKTIISSDLTVAIPDGVVTAIVGPNACGKSTLLRSLSRLLAPKGGRVILDGESINSYPSKEVARRLGLLPQHSTAPDGIRVVDLVSRGRYPHQSLIKQWTERDEAAVVTAMGATGVGDLAGRVVDELSGGQRQRVWFAMVLAQETPLILLDEPTTYLDVAYQIDLLTMCRRLMRENGHTIVAVLHDLHHACRFADHIIVMKQGAIVAEGRPVDIVTAELVEHVFGLPCRIIADPETLTPIVIPLSEESIAARGTQLETQTEIG
ncbi:MULTISPECIES: ABC transporter ATP-binding protein [Gordonia]|uniref:ABC transporter ATP-binding protein n=1 Tax=Gordonia TaxID=2053 RepID=UPI003016B672